MLDGGRPVPRAAIEQVSLVPIPRIQRIDGKLAPLDAQLVIEQTMEERRQALAEIMGRIRPDVVVIEHYPFSKRELGDEIGAMVQCAHAANPALKVICSVRDILPQTRNESCSPQDYAAEVLHRLNAQFDALMVHADPELSRLEDYFPQACEIRIPIEHTGIVAENILPLTNMHGSISEHRKSDKLVIASAGGGADAAGLIEIVAEAWRMLRHAGELDGYRLILFDGLNNTTGISLPDDDSISHFPFSADYLLWMQACELSISCAGYNTVANILRSSCRALLVPNLNMSDQLARARIMEGLGIESIFELPRADAMAAAILKTLGKPSPSYRVNLEGAGRSAEFIATLVGTAVNLPLPESAEQQPPLRSDRS